MLRILNQRLVTRFGCCFTVLAMMVLSGCASRSVLIDTAQQVNFSQLQRFAITLPNQQDTLALQRLQAYTQQFLNEQGKVLVEADAADAVLEIDHYIEQRANDSSFSIGLGTGTSGRSGGIGVGGSINLPIGADTIPVAIVSVKVLIDKRLVWSASNAEEIDADSDSGIAEAQQVALSEIYEQLIDA